MAIIFILARLPVSLLSAREATATLTLDNESPILAKLVSRGHVFPQTLILFRSPLFNHLCSAMWTSPHRFFQSGLIGQEWTPVSLCLTSALGQQGLSSQRYSALTERLKSFSMISGMVYKDTLVGRYIIFTPFYTQAHRSGHNTLQVQIALLYDAGQPCSPE